MFSTIWNYFFGTDQVAKNATSYAKQVDDVITTGRQKSVPMLVSLIKTHIDYCRLLADEERRVYNEQMMTGHISDELFSFYYTKEVVELNKQLERLENNFEETE